jgi:hypothetical protein
MNEDWGRVHVYANSQDVGAVDNGPIATGLLPAGVNINGFHFGSAQASTLTKFDGRAKRASSALDPMHPFDSPFETSTSSTFHHQGAK